MVGGATQGGGANSGSTSAIPASGTNVEAKTVPMSMSSAVSLV